jgi:small subunit ribosomal protein S17
MDKSIVVRVERSWRHPLYGKVVKTAKKYHAHDENNEAREGDRVRLLESRPISKLKKWVLLEIVERPERV